MFATVVGETLRHLADIKRFPLRVQPFLQRNDLLSLQTSRNLDVQPIFAELHDGSFEAVAGGKCVKPRLNRHAVVVPPEPACGKECPVEGTGYGCPG